MTKNIKIELIKLGKINSDTVQDVFKKKLHIYWMLQSKEVVVDGELLSGMERALLLVLGRNDKDGKTTVKEIEVSDVDKNDNPLTVERFISNQLKKYEPLYQATIGSGQFDSENAQLKIYIDYLKAYKAPDEPSKKFTRLDQLFEYTSQYKAVMEILVSRECIDPNTHIWIDRTSGNKTFLAALIKDLHAKGYYKGKMPTNDEIELICKNTFRWDVGIDTIKRAKPIPQEFKFIPTSSTLLK